METAIVSVICIALMVIGGMTMSQGFLTSVDTTSAALEELGVRDEEIMRTNYHQSRPIRPLREIFYM